MNPYNIWQDLPVANDVHSVAHNPYENPTLAFLQKFKIKKDRVKDLNKNFGSYKYRRLTCYKFKVKSVITYNPNSNTIMKAPNFPLLAMGENTND